MGWARGGTLMLAASLALSGCTSTFFVCGSNDECTGEGEGTCEPSGYCSFPDETCPSGRRYGDLAGGALAGACVEPMDGAGSTGATSTTGVTTSSPTTTLSTSGSTEPASATDPAAESSTTTDPSSGTTSSSDSSSDGSSTGVGPVCGDELVEPPETCDDGNTVDGDGCNPTCNVPGEVLWSDVIHVGSNDRGYALAVGPQGEIAIGGFVTTDDGPRAFVRLYQDDTELWSFTATQQEGSQAWGLGFTDDGDVLVAGWREGAAGHNPWRARLGADGEVLWEVVDEDTGRIWDLDVANAEEFCVGGERAADPLDAYAGCFSSATGEMVSELTGDLGAGTEDWVESVSVDGDTIYIGGTGSQDGVGRAGFVQAIERSTGQILWSSWIPGDGTGRTGVFGLGDAGSSLALAGTRNVSGSGWQAIYGSVDKMGGALEFEEFGGPANDEAFGIATDDGATFVGGFITNNVTRGYVERVTDPTWTHEVIGNGPGFNRIFDVAFAPDGNLVAVGYQSDADDGFDIVALRLAR